MAITKVRIKIDGTWNNLVQNADGKWKGTVTAPASTSYNLSGGAYPVTVEATNDAGTVKTWESTDSVWGSLLKLVVKETIKPSVVLVSPSHGSYVTNNKQPFTFTVTDEAGGSGVDLATVKLQIDNGEYDSDSSGMLYSAITNGYRFVFTPQTALKDGTHTLTVNASDNDGNAADTVNASITVDTVPPMLTVSEPVEGLITNKPNQRVSGITNDNTSSPVNLNVVLNGTNLGTETVGTDGNFVKELVLKEGENTIVITATDAAGKTSTVTRTVKLDTSIPEIKKLTLAPNPASTSASLSITIEVI